jgi:hypothetical protein
VITKKTQHKVIEWLAAGSASEPAKVIALWLAFGIKHRAVLTPARPEEFEGCLQLLGAVPELREYHFRLAKLSAAWKVLIAEWSAIEAKFREEAELPRYQVTAAMLREAEAAVPSA